MGRGIELLSDSIVSLILSEGKVVIPELGYLELKVFPDKRTVLFKNTEKTALFSASEDSVQSQIYDNLTIPLKAGKVVTLPEVGVFHPMKRADGSYRISYTPSSSLRRLLNGEKEEAKEAQEIKEIEEVEVDKVDIVDKSEEEIVVDEVVEEVEVAEEEVKAKKELAVIQAVESEQEKEVVDIVVPQEREKRHFLQSDHTHGMMGIVAIAATLMALILFVSFPGSKIIIFLILGFYIPRFFQFKKQDIFNLRLLWVYHLIFSIYYYFFLRADSYTYYIIATEQMTSQDFWASIIIPGTDFINAICYSFVNVGFSSYLSLFLFFSFVGYIGIVLLYKMILMVIPIHPCWGKIRLFPFLLFLPNLHLWSVAVGKDTLLFLCVNMVAYGFMQISRRFPLVVIGLLLSFWIRPHVTLLLLISFGLAYAINSKIFIPQRVLLVIFITVVAGFVLPSVLNFVKMDELSMDELEQFSERQAAGLSNAGSGLELSSYPYPVKVFTFLYRPLFFDVNGIPALIVSFENLLWLLLSIQVIRNRFFETFKAGPLVVQSLFLFFIMGTLVFCMSMSNLGIIIRQRNMFLPGLILFILWSFSYKQALVLRRKD